MVLYGVPFVSKFRLGSIVLLGAEMQFGVDVILAGARMLGAELYFEVDGVLLFGAEL